MDARSRDAMQEYGKPLVHDLPEWAPASLSYKGRPKYDDRRSRDARWEWLRTAAQVSAKTRADQAAAWACQELYWKQVRAKVRAFEAFRQTELTKEQRKDWQEALRLFVFDNLTRSTAARATTVIGWAIMLSPRLPNPPKRAFFATLVRSLGQANLLRPTGRVRGRQGQLAAALARAEEYKTKFGRVLWAAVMLMASGARRSDACRVVTGGIEEHELASSAAIFYPTTEKTDAIGSRESEPMVVLCKDEAQAERLISVVTAVSQPRPEELETKVSEFLHGFGIEDVRATRRDAAAACCSREGANLLLRHKAGSARTLGYSGTRDRIQPLLRLARRVRFATNG